MARGRAPRLRAVIRARSGGPPPQGRGGCSSESRPEKGCTSEKWLESSSRVIFGASRNPVSVAFVLNLTVSRGPLPGHYRWSCVEPK
jgi:hypothetical protein